MNHNDDDLALVRRALSGEERAAETIYSLGSQLAPTLDKWRPSRRSRRTLRRLLREIVFGAGSVLAEPIASWKFEANGPLIAWLKKVVLEEVSR